MLKLDPLRILFQIVNFLILVFLLYRLLFGPVMRRVRERSAQIRALVEEARRQAEEAEALRQALEEQRRRLDSESEAIISQAGQRAEEERRVILEDARREAEAILAEARLQAKQERDQAIAQYTQALVETVLDVSGQMIGKVLPETTHEALVAQLLEHIYDLGRQSITQVEAFRRSLVGPEADALVLTPQPLSSEQQGQLVRTLTALADRRVNLRIEQAPDLIAGIRVRIGDLVIGNSVRGQLERLRESASHALEERLHHD